MRTTVRGISVTHWEQWKTIGNGIIHIFQVLRREREGKLKPESISSENGHPK